MSPAKRLLSISVAAGLGVIAGAARAQSCQPLEGEWAFSGSESRVGAGLAFNPHDAVTGIELSIRGGRQIAQRWDFHGPYLQRTARYELQMDGLRRPTGIKDPKDFEYSDIAAEWQNCTLIVHGLSHLFGLEVATTDTYVVSEDGRRLSILRAAESPVAVTDQTLVFLRQGATSP